EAILNGLHELLLVAAAECERINRKLFRAVGVLERCRGWKAADEHHRYSHVVAKRRDHGIAVNPLFPASAVEFEWLLVGRRVKLIQPGRLVVKQLEFKPVVGIGIQKPVRTGKLGRCREFTEPLIVPPGPSRTYQHDEDESK